MKDYFELIVCSWIDNMRNALKNSAKKPVKLVGRKIIDGLDSFIHDTNIIEEIASNRKKRIFEEVVSPLPENAVVEFCIGIKKLGAAQSYNLDDLKQSMVDYLYEKMFE